MLKSLKSCGPEKNFLPLGMKYKKGDKVFFRFAGGSFTGTVVEGQTGYTGATKYTIEGTSFHGRYFAYEKDMLLAKEGVTIEDLLTKNQCKKENKVKK